MWDVTVTYTPWARPARPPDGAPPDNFEEAGADAPDPPAQGEIGAKIDAKSARADAIPLGLPQGPE
jgi:hypothetical protein